MASNARSPVRRPPAPEFNNSGSNVIHPGEVSPLRTYCTLRTLKKRQQKESWHKIYRFRSDQSSAADDERGFINGQKLEQQKTKIMSLQGPDIFPLCRGVNRYWDDGRLYPQYGDLHSGLFMRDRAPFPSLLKIKRSQLLSRYPIESVQVPTTKGEMGSSEGESQQRRRKRSLEESSDEPSEDSDEEPSM
jgi:hypothetical protein